MLYLSYPLQSMLLSIPAYGARSTLSMSDGGAEDKRKGERWLGRNFRCTEKGALFSHTHVWTTQTSRTW